MELPDRTGSASAGQQGSVQALRREFEHSYYRVFRKPVKHLHDLVYREAIFQILENGGHWDARAAENPRIAEFPRNAFHRRTLGPVVCSTERESCHTYCQE